MDFFNLFGNIWCEIWNADWDAILVAIGTQGALSKCIADLYVSQASNKYDEWDGMQDAILRFAIRIMFTFVLVLTVGYYLDSATYGSDAEMFQFVTFNFVNP